MRPARFAYAMTTAAIGLIAASAAQASDSCANLKSFSFPGMSVSVTKAESVPPGPLPPPPFGKPLKVDLPGYCRIEGMINPHKSADGKDYGIGFAVSLPENWSGQFLFEGGGGLDGTVKPPFGGDGAGAKPALARGMSVATTDSGHHANEVFDASFFADQQAVVDFEYASIGTVTTVAKAIIAKYYGKSADHSYFTGCSMGGREAMIATQRYPLEFDGAIAGAPAMRVGYSGIGDLWVSSTFAQIAPKDEKGNPIPDKVFSDSDRKLIMSSLLDACDAKDGIKDGMIFNVAACKFDPQKLKCTGAKAEGCLSQAQADALDIAFAGPKDSKGNAAYTGFFYDTGIDATGFIPGLLVAAAGPAGAPSPAPMDVDAAVAQAASSAEAQMGDSANFVNLSTFASRGGKLIFFHGVSDPWFSAMDTLAYYKRLGTANGGIKSVMNWSRAFLVPGMGHCGGGTATLDSFDLLTPLVSWVEKSKAPDSVVATGDAFPGRSRPLCAWPKHAHYKGSSNPEDAKNYICKD